jgi:hypothetical protein
MTTLEKYLAWFKAHERLLLFLAASLLVVMLYHMKNNSDFKHDQVQAQIATTEAAAASQKFTSDQATNAALVQQLATMQTTFATQVASLQAQIAATNKQTQQQKTVDASMTDVQLAQRWAALIQVKPEEVTIANVPLTLQISDNASHITVAKLEDGAACSTNLMVTQSELAAANTLNSKQNAVITSNAATIVDGAAALQTEKKSHADDVVLLKKQNRKSFWHGVKVGVGVVVGVIGGIALASHV